jgi:hypothetical protein
VLKDGDTVTVIKDLKIKGTSLSVTLQEQGIGEHRLLGCGLFLPQKGIESVDEVQTFATIKERV